MVSVLGCGSGLGEWFSRPGGRRGGTGCPIESGGCRRRASNGCVAGACSTRCLRGGAAPRSVISTCAFGLQGPTPLVWRLRPESASERPSFEIACVVGGVRWSGADPSCGAASQSFSCCVARPWMPSIRRWCGGGPGRWRRQASGDGLEIVRIDAGCGRRVCGGRTGGGVPESDRALPRGALPIHPELLSLC